MSRDGRTRDSRLTLAGLRIGLVAVADRLRTVLGMDDTHFFLEAAAAAQSTYGGSRWAAFWRWCVSHGHQPMPASEEALRLWLESVLVIEGLDEAYACLLEVLVRHDELNEPHPLADSLPGRSL